MRKYELTINEKAFSIAVKSFSAKEAELEVNGKPYKVRVDEIISDSPMPLPASRRPAPGATAPRASAPTPAASAPTASGGAGSVTAPIPGLILEVHVKVGDTVTAGQGVLKMEAMKMENVINATVGGSVTAILVKPGDTVTQGQELMIVG